MSADGQIVVIGVGNSYRGDDAAGLLVASALAGTLPPGVAVHRCEQEPSRIMDAEAYFVTSRAPRAFTLMTRSNTAMSVSMGVAISPPSPPQLTTP